ncbi:DNA repair protein rad50 [Mycoemilia scoparia]|uniref:DNA repair protein RAD50 n=1 Tax=Mycoemilia scoparia TaxID=417184 RepID=A0A9W8DNT7_9FUNG|nr:DNA repair protein rad50 [Mycoemilia scoparia]
MSSIDKLLVQGIRSFDPQNAQTLQFYTPLTLITIIECLKYATTGELPPNSKGGAFIHDPKLLGENIVKAQVRLMFKDVNQSPLVCSRSIQLTQKRTTVAQKTLEGVIYTVPEPGAEKESVSLRCSDMDAEMSNRLGVPRAILDNVIFCHQEEANWPLSEPSVLKKKFDEIFSATRYTKALDSIKQIRKDQTVEVKLHAKELKHLEEKKVKSDKIRIDLKKTQKHIKSYQETIEELNSEEEGVHKQINELLQKMSEYNDIRYSISQLEHSIQISQSNHDELVETTQKMNDSEESLLEIRDNHQINVETLELQHSEKRGLITELQNKINELRNEIMGIVSEKGILETEQARYVSKSNSLKDLLKTIVSDHGIDCSGIGNSIEIMEELDARYKDLESKITKIREISRKKEGALQKESQGIGSKVASTREAIRFHRIQITNNENELQSMKYKVKELGVSEGKIETLTKRLEKEEADLEQLRLSIEAENAQEIIEDKRSELQVTEMDINELNKEIALLNRSADTRAKLSIEQGKQKEFSEKCKSFKKKLQSLNNISLDKISELEERERELQNELQNSCSSLDTIEKGLQKKKAEKQSIETRLNMLTQSKKKYASDLRQKKRQISEVCEVDEFEKTFENLKEGINQLTEEIGFFKSATDMYSTYIETSEKERICPLCNRDFPQEKDLLEFISKLRIDYKKAPVEMIRTQESLKDITYRYNTIQSLQPIFQDIQRLQNETIPDLDKQISDLETDLLDATADLSQMEEDVNDSRKKLESIEANQDIVQKYIESLKLLEDIENTIHDLEESLEATGSLKTLDECYKDLESLQTLNRNLRQEVDNLSNDRHKKQLQWSESEGRVRDINSLITKEQSKIAERDRIIDQIKQLEASTKTELEKISELEPTLANMEYKFEEIQTKIEDLRNKAEAEQQEINTSIRKIEKSRDELKNLLFEIEGFDSKNLEKNIRVNKDLHKEATKKMEVLNRDLSKAEEQWKKIDHQLNNLKEYERAVSDNLKIYNYQRELQKQFKQKDELMVKLKELEGKMSLGSDDNDNGEEESDDENHQPSGRNYNRNKSKSPLYKKPKKMTYDERMQNLKQRHSKAISEKAGLLGEVKQLEDQARRYEYELRSDYKNIEKEYRDQSIVHKTSEVANKDLEKYSKALDNAIMEYHSLKMQEINKIIRELWYRTYRGTDIETIEIRSQNDGKSTRSYNYRVVMIKNGQAIDMRGRCSAGQKVMTSLIIRLALAETFGQNCGILALDEPTTNLDRANIKSFAENLIKIIEARRKQSNFQLIVITHDEDFLQLIGRSEFADYYWRVSKNDMQRSSVKKMEIAYSG